MADEETPLLISAETPAAVVRKEPDEVITPLPKVQVGVLLFILLTEPICSQCIYPFINQLINELGITGGDEKKLGYYAGIIESLFFFAGASSTFLWSRLSDYIGRKPVLMTGTMGLMISMISFGLSRTFGGLVVSRCLAGFLNGNIGVVRSMIGEITDSTNRAQVSGLLPLTWGVGVTVGPFAGGTLSRPHERFPALFGNWFWEEYPYLLPCLFSAAFCAFCFVIMWLFLKETVKRNYPSQDGGEAHPDHAYEPVPPLRAILTEPVVLSIASHIWLCFIDIAYRALQPLFYATPIHLGGLGMSPAKIGLFLGGFGILNGVVQGLFFAKIVRRIGLKKLFLTGTLCFIPLFAMFPIISHFVRKWGLSPAVQALAVFQIMINCVTAMCFGCAFLYMTSSVGNRRALGSVNGLGQTAASLSRALGPVIATPLFAYTLQTDLLGGLGVYVVFIAISLCGIPIVSRLPEKEWVHK